jgi:4'-phosphopantetheinyl transferase
VVELHWHTFAELAKADRDAAEDSATEDQALEQLSHEERQRAARLRVVEQRQRFIAYRAALRRALASYAGVAPAQVPLSTSDTGKPYWADPVANVRVAFNHAHTRRLAVVAVAAEGDVGVDLEEHEPTLRFATLASTMLSPSEQGTLAHLPPPEQPSFVLSRWTLKEALLKGLAIGLAVPLGSVTIQEKGTASFCATGGDNLPNLDSWQLASWEPLVGLHVSVAYRGPGSFTIQHVPSPATVSFSNWLNCCSAP